MDSEENKNDKNIKQKQLSKILIDLEKIIKDKNYLEGIKLLISVQELITNIIEEISSNKKDNHNKIIDKELIKHFSFFKNINSFIKDKNILLQIKSILNDILNIIFIESNYSYITEPILFQELIVNCLSIIYLNSKTNLIFFLLLKKVDNYIKYIIDGYPSYKDSILSSRKTFKDYHCEIYLNYKKEFKSLNIYNLSKSEDLKDKKQSLFLLSNFFNNLKYFTEKYELLKLISKEVFPSLLSITLPDFSHKKNSKNLELYINFGNFLLRFLFSHEYIFDFSSFNLKSEEISEKYPCIFLYNKNEINNLDLLNNRQYKILYKYEIIKEYRKELVDIIINYYIKHMIIYDTNFDIQFIIFKLLKYLYFMCQNNTNDNIKNKFINYIPEILNNLSFFKKQEEFDKASESREFGYYLLLKEPQFKFSIKSLTNSPKEETDIYTTKLNVAYDLINNWFYVKEEIEKGKSLEIFEKINKKFGIIYLEFYVEDNKEITVTVYKKNEKETEYKQIGFNNIIKTVKNEKNKNENENCNDYKSAKIIIINSSSNIHKNNIENELNYKNEFKIVFDNYDAWFTNRVIHYSISVFDIYDI